MDVQVISVSAWVYVTSRAVQYQQIVHRQKFANETYANELFSLGYMLTNSGHVFSFATQNDYADGQYVYTPNANDPADLNSWIHVVGTYDGQTTKIYRNGVLADSKSLSSIRYLNVDPAGIVGMPICIGNAANTSTLQCGEVPNGFWVEGVTGNIDEVSIWSRVLSLEEVNTIYKAQSTSNWVLK